MFLERDIHLLKFRKDNQNIFHLLAKSNQHEIIMVSRKKVNIFEYKYYDYVTIDDIIDTFIFIQ